MKKIFDDHIRVIEVVREFEDEILKFSEIIINSLKNGKKVFIMGNGGSAADSQHMAGELVGRFKKERKGFPAIALSTDGSVLTSIGNDYSFDNIFSRQIEALAGSEDVVIGISTSGNSENIDKALTTAKEIGCVTTALLGCNGGKIKDNVDFSITVPVNDTPRVQEAHILIIHILCELIENGMN